MSECHIFRLQLAPGAVCTMAVDFEQLVACLVARRELPRQHTWSPGIVLTSEVSTKWERWILGVDRWICDEVKLPMRMGYQVGPNLIHHWQFRPGKEPVMIGS